jgi:MFS family permease
MLPWLVAIAFFMESLDTTVLNTAVPAMARALHESELAMKSVLASYALSLAMFIPASGWMADRLARGAFFPPPSRCSPWDRCCAACATACRRWWCAA